MGRIFFPQYKRGRKGISLHKGLTILEHLRELGIEINAECGGKGECGRCVVRIEKGMENLNGFTHHEISFSLPLGERLACQARIVRDTSDIVVFIKEFGKYEILKRSKEREVPLNPLTFQRESKVIYNHEVLDDYRGRIYGLAIDVGTTTLVFDIVDLQSGEVIATIAKTNPQILYGNDVISRIEYTMVNKKSNAYLEEDERVKKIKEMQRCVIESINQSLKEFESERNDLIAPYVYEAVVVGNPTMRNIFFGLDVSSLGHKPYEPVHKEPIVKEASDLGLAVFPKARIYGAALIGGHAGADALADVLVSQIYKDERIGMVIDIGTNGEIVLGNSRRLISASCAAGGAYEGATIPSGIGAIEGAIKNIKIKNGKVLYETIGNTYPVGICGSGLIDLLAELLRCGIMDRKAKIKEDFYVEDGIKITQPDIYQLITAKAGLKTDQLILLKYYGIEIKDLDKIYLSGGFGNYIDIKNAIKIGLLPDAEEKIVKIGNGALEGAREMLVCKESRKASEEIVKKIEHVKPNELEKDFAYLVAENMYF
ncbi:DUF4445 domain-containing protein [Candidatus Calescamantes bacterium]|nr:DUF4445 domain-containing protein [Candidatus Calescamantes bacterium]